MAEILGGAIALQMLLGLPLRAGAVIVAAVSLVMLLTNSYMRVERWIIGFVSLIGLSFLFEIALVHVDWSSAAVGWVAPTVPVGSPAIIVSVLGAVVMPHNLFLHSEIIQSQCINERGDDAIAKRLRSEFVDTLFSMVVGWAINSAMVLLAASVFWNAGTPVTDLAQAACTLEPMLGAASSTVFALALLFAGVSSSITAGMAAGTISAGLAGEPYDVRDRHSSIGVVCTFLLATASIFFVQDAFQGLVWSPGAFVFAAAHHSFCPDMAHELPARYGKVCKRRRTKGNADGHRAYRHGSQRGAPIGGVKEPGCEGGRA